MSTTKRKREQELLTLTRDYDNLKSVYESLLNRKLEAEIAVSMEKKQKGEQFRVIDPAQVPLRPVEPDVNRLFVITLVLGLGVGCGLAYLIEFMDTSYKVPEEMEKELQLPLLISMPIIYTEKELGKKKRGKIITAVSVVAGFILSAVAIVIVVKGVDPAIAFMKAYIGMVKL